MSQPKWNFHISTWFVVFVFIHSRRLMKLLFSLLRFCSQCQLLDKRWIENFLEPKTPKRQAFGSSQYKRTMIDWCLSKNNFHCHRTRTRTQRTPTLGNLIMFQLCYQQWFVAVIVVTVFVIVNFTDISFFSIFHRPRSFEFYIIAVRNNLLKLIVGRALKKKRSAFFSPFFCVKRRDLELCRIHKVIMSIK